jgi:hypothetical protein
MGRKILAGALLAFAVVAFGCSDNTSSTSCQPYEYAGAQPAYDSAQCVSAGGTCAVGCNPGSHPAPGGSTLANACSYGYDPGPNNCGTLTPNGAGIASQQCCLPDDGGADGATDAPTDAPSDRAHDGPAQIGSCAGTPCNAGCSCEILPQTQQAFCACVDGGASDAATPNCGSIWCFAGCTCADPGQSVCACP